MKKIFMIILFFFTLISLSAGHSGKKTFSASSITKTELRDHVFFLASDEIGGRLAETPGYKIAAKYANSQFKASGLKPVFRDARGKASFFQDVPLIKRKILAPEPFTVVTPEGEFDFSAEENIRYPFFVSNTTFAGSLPLVFLGYGIEEPEVGWNDLEGLDFEGKIAIMLAGAPTRNGKPVLPKKLHEKHSAIPGILDRILQLADKENGPKALVVISNEVVDQAWEGIDSILGQVNYALKINIPDLLLLLPIDMVIVNRDIGRTLFKGQIYNPFDSENFEKKKYKRYELKGAGINFEPVYDDEDFLSWNVVGMVEGTNPALSDQYITVGAHLDAVAPVNSQINNGADDNASGSTGVLEIAEAVAQAPFQRPVIFALWTAEEGGAFGSQYFIEKPPVPLDKIKININLDMIGRSAPENKESRKHYTQGFDNTIISGLKSFIEEINNKTVKWPLSYVIRERIAGSSDHASFYKKGIPVFCFYSGHHDDVHMPSDDAERIDYEKMEKISQLTYWIIKELAGKDEIPNFQK
ncbi:M20/M25/M40 family metallo-hydrolase [Acidobacteriota bacterium]